MAAPFKAHGDNGAAKKRGHDCEATVEAVHLALFVAEQRINLLARAIQNLLNFDARRLARVFV